MILGWLRLALVLLAVSGALYLALRLHTRSLKREALEREWDAGMHMGSGPEAREAWIEAELALWQASVMRRLLWLVCILPMLAFTVIFFYVNHS